MGAHKGLMENAREDLAEQFRRAGMDREPSSAEIRQRLKEIIDEMLEEAVGEEVCPRNHPTRS